MASADHHLWERMLHPVVQTPDGQTGTLQAVQVAKIPAHAVQLRLEGYQVKGFYGTWESNHPPSGRTVTNEIVIHLNEMRAAISDAHMLTSEQRAALGLDLWSVLVDQRAVVEFSADFPSTIEAITEHLMARYG